MNSKPQLVLVVAKWYLMPFLLIAVFAYRCWYDRLAYRGFGNLYNALKHHDQFVVAQILFGLIGVGGIVLFEVSRKHLQPWMRFAYVALIASMIAFFVVDWIVVLVGPTPHWHHP